MNAKEAFAQSQANHEFLAPRIEDAIKEAIRFGEFSCDVRNLSKNQIVTLEKAGYKLSALPAIRWWRIDWSE